MDRQAAVFVQDLFCVLVAMVSISLLLVDLAYVHDSFQRQNGQRELEASALHILEDFLGYGPALRDGGRGIFDEIALGELALENISRDLRIDLGFLLRIDEVAIEERPFPHSWLWSSGSPAENRGSCVASASVHGENGVAPARVVAWVWRV